MLVFAKENIRLEAQRDTQRNVQAERDLRVAAERERDTERTHPVEAMFNSGFFVIVPDLPDDPSVEEIFAWQQSEPKEYKFKLINLQHHKVDKFVPELRRT